MDEERTPLLRDTTANGSAPQPADPQPCCLAAWSRIKSAVAYITTSTELVLVLYMCYFSGSLPLIGQFIYTKVAVMQNYTGPLPNSDNNQSKEMCERLNTSDPMYVAQQRLQEEATLWSNYNNVAYLVPGFFSCIYLGGYSDKAGRKVAIILPLIGCLIKCCLYIVLIVLELHIAFILMASVLESIFGGPAVIIMGCFAYIADVTTHSNRSFRIIVLEVSIGVGIVISQLATGFIIHLMGYMWPFVILGSILAGLLLYVIFRVKETIVSSRPVTKCSADYFTQTFKLYLFDDGNKRRSRLLVCLSIVILVSTVKLAATTVEMLKMMKTPLCWSSVLIGAFGAWNYFMNSIGSLSMTKLFQPRIGDLKLVIAGCLAGVAYELIFSFAETDWQLFIAPVAGFCSLLPIGMVRAYTSKIVDAKEMGSLFASIAWAELLGALVGNLAFNAIYGATLYSDLLTGLVFQIMALVYMFVIIITGALLLCQKPENLEVQAAIIRQRQEPINA